MKGMKMAIFFFAVSLLMAALLAWTGEPWLMLPQWAAIFWGFVITILEFLDERRKHAEFMKRHEVK